jgi:hypothetical protein
MFRLFSSQRLNFMPKIGSFLPVSNRCFGRNIYKEQKMRKENPIKIRKDDEEHMRKRFVRNRADAEFSAKAERSFKQYGNLYSSLIFRNEASGCSWGQYGKFGENV